MWHTIILIGNLGRDPEMRYTPNGSAVTSFSVATSRKYTSNNGQQVDETIWFRVNVWGKMAEPCNTYLKKGSKVMVEGRLVPDQSTGGPKTFARKDGSTGASFDISATTVKFLSSRAESAGAGGSIGEELPATGHDEEEIPF